VTEPRADRAAAPGPPRGRGGRATPAALTPTPTPSAGPAGGDAARSRVVAARWLETSQRIAGRAAHEVKNALNGVSVNLEVVRSRVSRMAAAEESGSTSSPSTASTPPRLASATARFAEVAAAQLDGLSALCEALLSIARPVREPADVAQLLAPLAVVLDAVARSEGGSLSVVSDGVADDAVRVAAPPDETRLVLAAALEGAVGRGREVTCRVEAGAGDGRSAAGAAGLRVRIGWRGGADVTAADDAADGGAVGASPEGARPAIARDVVALAAEAGIGVEQAPAAVTLTFAPAPAAGAGASPNQGQ
jgi:hypothetical protein